MSEAPFVRTDLARERKEQRRWRPRPGCAVPEIFDRLVEGEFLDPAVQHARQSAAVANVIRFAAGQVPYYRDIFAARGLKPEDIRAPGELARLPLLDKIGVRENENRLRPKVLPRGEKVFGIFSSSGTTGRPTRIVQSVASNAMFSYLSQREYRWFRFDPSAPFAFIRLASQLPPGRDGRVLADGATRRLSRWRYVGRFFETGPWLGFAVTNPVEHQIA